MSLGARNFLLLLTLAGCWGPSFLFIKIAVEYVPPIAITAIRMGIGATILFVILTLKSIKIPPLKPVLKIFTISALLQGAVPFSLFGFAEKTVDSAFAAIVGGAAPLFAMVMAHYCFANDRMTKAKIYGAILGFGGVFLLILPTIFSAHAEIFGVLILLCAAICYASAFVYSKKFIKVTDFQPFVIPFIQLVISFVILTVTSAIFEDHSNMKNASQAAIISLCGLGVIGTAIAFVIYYKLIEYTSVTYISMVNYLLPVFGTVLGMLILNEQLSWNDYLGGILILFGVMTANGVINFKKFLGK